MTRLGWQWILRTDFSDVKRKQTNLKALLSSKMTVKMYQLHKIASDKFKSHHRCPLFLSILVVNLTLIKVNEIIQGLYFTYSHNAYIYLWTTPNFYVLVGFLLHFATHGSFFTPSSYIWSLVGIMVRSTPVFWDWVGSISAKVRLSTFDIASKILVHVNILNV